MPTYVYKNTKGDRREIDAPMRAAPPAEIRCLSGDHINPQWRPRCVNDADDTVHRRVYEIPPAGHVKGGTPVFSGRR